MFWWLAGKTVLAVSLLAGVGLALLHWRSYERELVVSDAESGTYREARCTRGRLLLTIATGWNEDQKPKSGWAATGGGEGFALLDGRRLVEFGTPAVSSPLKTTGSLSIIKPLMLPPGIVMNLTTAPSTQAVSLPIAPVMDSKGKSSWTGLGAPSLTRESSGVGGDLQTSLGSSFELTIVPKPPPPRAQTSTLTIRGSSTLRLTAYPYERYTVPLPMIAGVVLTPVWCKIVVVAARWRRRRGRVKRGLCVQCGYDLRGSPGACPECGMPR